MASTTMGPLDHGTPHVLSSGDRFQMIWAHAGLDETEMIELHDAVERAVREPPGYAMGLTMDSDAFVGILELSVPLGAAMSEPDPAGSEVGPGGRHRPVHVDLGPESFLQGRGLLPAPGERPM